MVLHYLCRDYWVTWQAWMNANDLQELLGFFTPVKMDSNFTNGPWKLQQNISYAMTSACTTPYWQVYLVYKLNYLPKIAITKQQCQFFTDYIFWFKRLDNLCYGVSNYTLVHQQLWNLRKINVHCTVHRLIG